MSYNELKQHGTADFPIELYSMDESDPRYEMVSHWHTEIEIIRVLKGTLNVKLNNHTYAAGEDCIIFVNPETVHGAMPRECVYECLDFNIGLLSAFCDGCKYFVEGISNGEYIINEYISPVASSIKNAVNEVFEAMKNKSSGYKFKVIGALYKLLGVIIDEHFYSQANGVPAMLTDKNVVKLKNVLSFIRKNYDTTITLGDMAASSEMSPKYFCYFFKEMTRKTPIEYLNAYRVERASRSLLNSDRSVTEIAFACGFNDLSYFIKTFKAIKGKTPAKFRKGE